MGDVWFHGPIVYSKIDYFSYIDEISFHNLRMHAVGIFQLGGKVHEGFGFISNYNCTKSLVLYIRQGQETFKLRIHVCTQVIGTLRSF